MSCACMSICLSVYLSICMRMSYCKYTLLQVTKSLHRQWIPTWTTCVSIMNYLPDFDGCNFKLNKDGDHSWTHLFQWQQRWGLLHDNKGGEKLQWRRQECFLSVHQWLYRQGLATVLNVNNDNDSPTETSLKLCQREYCERRAAIDCDVTWKRSIETGAT